MGWYTWYKWMKWQYPNITFMKEVQIPVHYQWKKCKVGKTKKMLVVKVD